MVFKVKQRLRGNDTLLVKYKSRFCFELSINVLIRSDVSAIFDIGRGGSVLFWFATQNYTLSPALP